MHRRDFARWILGALPSASLLPATGALSLGALGPADRAGFPSTGPGPNALGPLSTGAIPELEVDGARLNRTMEELARFGATPEEGINRVAFSDADLEAREYVRELMESGGLRTWVDEAGNLLGRREGEVEGLPPIMFGSHTDSVPDGGNYDGQVGSMSSVEVARRLHEEGIATRHPLEVVIFANEEGGKTGSRAMSGEVEPSEWDLPTASGYTIGEGTARIGGDPDGLDRVQRHPGDVAAFLELHIEQGAILEEEGIQIGVVEGIVGIRRWNVDVTGFANHAGTTPMAARQDPMVAAGRFIDRVYRTALELPGRQVATVGRIEASPGAPNVIPGSVRLSLEIRDLEMERIDEVLENLEHQAREIGRESGTEFAFTPFYLSAAAPTDPRLQELVQGSADSLGLSTLHMPSGAGHDAQSLALLAPVGMIFVPSVEGISHSPREFTHPEDIVNGANVLLRTVLQTDARDW
jgi:beta-ureidopropionase / N-carbamoyl-L-amino-acid hydrolase